MEAGGQVSRSWSWSLQPAVRDVKGADEFKRNLVKLYTSTMTHADVAEAAPRGIGCLVASSPHRLPDEAVKRAPHMALDNGAFTCWGKGYPFQSAVFLRTLERCYKLGVSLDWIVIPDIVAGGVRSLDFSVSWVVPVAGPLHTAPRLALVVQDGMTVQHVRHCGLLTTRRVSCIFVGGTLEWKWATASEWVSFAHGEGMICHIGRCGTVDALERAEEAGADSVDSSSWARNGSWGIVDRWREGRAAEGRQLLGTWMKEGTM